MDTKKSNVNTGSQQKGKKRHSGLTTAAGMGIATVAGATIGRAFPSGEDHPDPNEEVLVDVTPEEVIEETQQEEQTIEQPVQESKQAEEPVKEDESAKQKVEQQKEDDLEKNPDDVVEKIINTDEIDDPEYGNEIRAIEMRNITDPYGNEQEAMIFEDEDGYQFALCQSEPGSGIFDKVVDPDTFEEIELSQEVSYTRADFEELLHDDGGYIAPDPNGSIYADNDDITQDIKTTDDGQMLAQHDSDHQPTQNIDIDIDELDEPEISESEEEMIAQLIPDDDDEPDINDELIDIIDKLFDKDEPEEDDPGFIEGQPENPLIEEEFDEDEIDEDEVYDDIDVDEE